MNVSQENITVTNMPLAMTNFLDFIVPVTINTRTSPKTVTELTVLTLTILKMENAT